MTKQRTPPSIHLRLLAASLLILPLFLGMTAYTLDRAFANDQMKAQRESMRLQQLLLAKAADWDGANWTFSGLDELRFSLLRSGLYAFVLSTDGNVLWQSPSAELMDELEDPGAAIESAVRKLALDRVDVGQSRFLECEAGALQFCYSTRIAWGSSGPESIFLIVENAEQVLQARSAWRSYLLWLLLATALLLLLAQSAIFRWGLAPLRRIAAAIGRLERGESDRLEEPYAAELVPLTDNLNGLISSERRRRERVRNTMDRLTHVLKTPLMLIRNSSDNETDFRALAQEQVTRMLGIVEGELAKARLDGRAADILGKPVSVKPVLERITSAYARLPRRSDATGKLVIDTEAVSADAMFYGEERDLQDLFGSILENSLKYAREHIQITALPVSEVGEAFLVLTIADDGDGIPEGLEQDILRRGARADTANLGQGLGLAIVVEIVSAYGGSLHTERSALGGALFVVKLPLGDAPAN
jgi:two-component system sensor histidine kinase PhoQ